MKLYSILPFQAVAIALLFELALGLSQEYCSSENTGSDYSAVYNIYQSNGACYTQCQANYAFAVVQWQNCWCSNYIPAEQLSVSECNQPCPGYPDEHCGNQGNDLFGYVALTKSSSGTAGSPSAASSTEASEGSSAPSIADSAAQTSQSTAFSNPQSQQHAPPDSSFFTSYLTSSSTVQSTSSTNPASPSTIAPTPSSTSTSDVSPSMQTQTVFQTQPITVFKSATPSIVVSFVTPIPMISSTTPAFSSDTTSTPNPSPTSSATPIAAAVPATTELSISATPLGATTATATPVTSVRVVTISGAIVTQTVTSTPAVLVGDNNGNSDLSLQRIGPSGGAIAGAVIGSLIGLALILLLGALLIRRGRKDNSAGKAGRPKRPRRNTSVLSRTGLLSRAGRSAGGVDEKHFGDPLYINTGVGTGVHSTARNSMFNPEGTSPVSPLAAASDGDNRRYSRPLVYDQRLNPAALFANAEANGSKVSVATMQDHSDYSRPLGIRNPDLRPSFESKNG